MNEGQEKECGGSESGPQQAGSAVAETKARLEVDKLNAEIEEIRARTTGPSAVLARWTGSVGLAVTILSLTAGGVGLYYGFKDFGTRSENEADRRARQLDFNVGREVIELSMSLSSSDMTKRRNAAILLSAYEEHSVPILVASLRTHDQVLADSVIRSLSLILDKPRIHNKPELVIKPLREEAEELFADELQKDEPDTLAMTFFADAFGEMFAETKNPDVLGALQRLETLITSTAETISDENLKEKLQALTAKVQEAHRAVYGN
jgi:hypothetical protein